MSFQLNIYLSSCGAFEAVPLAPGTGAVGAGAVALGLQTAVALWCARQVLGGGDEDAVRFAASSLAGTAKGAKVSFVHSLESIKMRGAKSYPARRINEFRN